MLPGTASEALLYVSNYANGTVTVYSYETRTLVGVLKGFSKPAGLCTDENGNIFVTTAGQLIEYKHGGTKPLKKLSDKGWNPNGCAVDATTGNVAVANWTESGDRGNLAVYPADQVPPKVYDLGLTFYFCGYNATGNLLADAVQLSYSPYDEFFSLHKGSTEPKLLVVGPSSTWFTSETFISWDGRYWAIGVKGNTIYRYAIVAEHSRSEGSTTLAGYDPNADLLSFAFAHHGTRTQIAVAEQYPDAVQIWEYPRGGRPLATITKGLDVPFGIAVSAASK